MPSIFQHPIPICEMNCLFLSKTIKTQFYVLAYGKTPTIATLFTQINSTIICLFTLYIRPKARSLLKAVVQKVTHSDLYKRHIKNKLCQLWKYYYFKLFQKKKIFKKSDLRWQFEKSGFFVTKDVELFSSGLLSLIFQQI